MNVAIAQVEGAGSRDVFFGAATGHGDRQGRADSQSVHAKVRADAEERHGRGGLQGV